MIVSISVLITGSDTSLISTLNCEIGVDLYTLTAAILHSALVLTHFGIFTTNPRHERIRTG